MLLDNLAGMGWGRSSVSQPRQQQVRTNVQALFGNCEMTHWGTEMTQVEVDQLNERVAWLERKMVRVLWLLVSIVSAFAGFVVAYTIDNSLGPGSIIIGIGIWLTVGFILQRQEFKGAPQHIQFIDP